MKTTTTLTLLDRARADLAAKLAGLPPAEREPLIHERARAEALFAAPVGQRAGRVFLLAAELRDELIKLLDQFPDDTALATAARESLAAAGLAPPDPWGAYGPDHFAGLEGQARGLLYFVGLMAELMVRCAPPESLDVPTRAARAA